MKILPITQLKTLNTSKILWKYSKGKLPDSTNSLLKQNNVLPSIRDPFNPIWARGGRFRQEELEELLYRKRN